MLRPERDYEASSLWHCHCRAAKRKAGSLIKSTSLHLSTGALLSIRFACRVVIRRNASVLPCKDSTLATQCLCRLKPVCCGESFNFHNAGVLNWILCWSMIDFKITKRSVMHQRLKMRLLSKTICLWCCRRVTCTLSNVKTQRFVLGQNLKRETSIWKDSHLKVFRWFEPWSIHYV